MDKHVAINKARVASEANLCYATIQPLPLPNDIRRAIRLKDLGNGVKRLSLPWAEQTHELVYESETQCFFVSQLTESVLLVIKPGNSGDLPRDFRTDASGKLIEGVLAWGIGLPPKTTSPDEATSPASELWLSWWKKKPKKLFGGHSELHNVSLAEEKGLLWLSLQIPNMVILVRAEDFLRQATKIKAKQVIELPDVIKMPAQQDVVPMDKHVGSPHVVRQNPRTKYIWVGLKGLAATRPGQQIRDDDCECCDIRAHLDNYGKFPRAVPQANAFAVWFGDPANLEKQLTFECQESPPMLAFDESDSVFVALDQTPELLYIKGGTELIHLKVWFPPKGKLGNLPQNTKRDFTGPGIVSTENANILWCALLGHNAALIRIVPKVQSLSCYYFPELKSPLSRDLPDLRFIHLDVDNFCHRLYCLSSSLLEDSACDAVVMFQFDDSWEDIEQVKVVPLPRASQKCKAHRILLSDDRQRIFVTEFTNSMLLQMPVIAFDNSDLAAGRRVTINKDQAWRFTDGWEYYQVVCINLDALLLAEDQARCTWSQALKEKIDAELFLKDEQQNLKIEQQKWFNSSSVSQAQQKLVQAQRKLSQAQQKLDAARIARDKLDEKREKQFSYLMEACDDV